MPLSFSFSGCCGAIRQRGRFEMSYNRHNSDPDEPLKSLSELTGWRRYLLLAVAVIVFVSVVIGMAFHLIRFVMVSGY